MRRFYNPFLQFRNLNKAFTYRRNFTTNTPLENKQTNPIEINNKNDSIKSIKSNKFSSVFNAESIKNSLSSNPNQIIVDESEIPGWFQCLVNLVCSLLSLATIWFVLQTIVWVCLLLTILISEFFR